MRPKPPARVHHLAAVPATDRADLHSGTRSREQMTPTAILKPEMLPIRNRIQR